MRNRLLLILGFCLLFFAALPAKRTGVEAVEIGRHNTGMMPGGKEADGIVGDFILRNDSVHALISGTQPLRRANMTTEYASVLQGCLYDLDLRDARNDQLTAFRPGGERGEMSLVRIGDGGAEGAGVIEAIRTAAKGDGLYTRHEYRLEKGWNYLKITSTYRNEGTTAKTIAPAAVWKGLQDEKQVGEVRVGDSIDSFDKRGYAWGPLKGSAPIEKEVTLQPGEEKIYQVAMAMAGSPLAAYGIVASLNGPTGEVSGMVLAPDKTPAVRASLLVSIGGENLPGYPDAKGSYSFRLPAGEHPIRMEDIGRDPLEHTVRVEDGKTVSQDFDVTAASMVRVSITDASGKPSPGKIQFIGIEGTPTPELGTVYRAHGTGHQYMSHDGKASQQVPPGNYLVRVTRGPEFDMFEQRIAVGKGKTVDVAAKLRRTVDTAGWVSTDFHAHSTPSGDNYTNTDDRIINFAAEQLEFIPTTEHNRIYDWRPHIERLGLSNLLKTVDGIELTGSGQHFNSFPLARDPFAQDGGAPRWSPDPRITALLLRTWITPTLEGGSTYDTGVNARIDVPLFEGKPDRWVQANHPIVGEVFFDRNKDGKVDGGFVGFEKLIDAAEVWSTEILNLSPTYIYSRDGETREIPNRTFGWLQMLNQGRHVWCVAVSDAHRVFNGGVGDWRTYVPSSTDEPSKIDHAEIIRNAKAGRMMITNGPFLEVETGDGLPIGSTIVAEGYVDLKIKVQAPNWLDIDRVQVMLSGRQPKEYNFTRSNHPEKFKDGVVKFDETVRVGLQQDEYLIVVATGEKSDLSKGWGLSWESAMHPVAYTNPIYVDVDHNGFQANGDNLGYPLMTAGR